MIYEAKEWKSPLEMAAHLSKSITDPSALRAHTANYFGKARAITDRQALELVQAERKKRERAKRIAEHNDRSSTKHDGEDYSPTFRQRPAPKATPITLKPAEPPKRVATGSLWPTWYRPPLRQRKLLPRELIKVVGADAGFTFDQMINGGRFGMVVAVRAVVYKILRERGLSLPQIARFMGKRDHSTIMNALEKFDHYCERYPGTLELFERHRDKPDAI